MRKFKRQARQALTESQEALADVRSRREEASRVSAKLRRVQRRNHFGPDFAIALNPRRDPR